MMEDAELQVENHHELHANSDDEDFAGLAYADVTLADEAWLENYNGEEQERLEEEEKFKQQIKWLGRTWRMVKVDLCIVYYMVSK